MNETKVINIKDAPDGWRDDPNFVYIGRANPRRRLRGSPFANPFKIGADGTREEVVAKYRAWLLENPELLASVKELAGKTLVCWCSPDACHGDVLAELADG